LFVIKALSEIVSGKPAYFFGDYADIVSSIKTDHFREKWI